MNRLLAVRLLVGAAAPVAAIQGFGDQATGYYPYCATACNRALGSNYLPCSFDGYAPGGMMNSDSASATPACRASNIPFLPGLLHQHSLRFGPRHPRDLVDCEEHGIGCTYVVPIYSYQESLMNVTKAPTHVIKPKQNLTSTQPDQLRESAWNTVHGGLGRISS
jgi:hypothetical protein